MKQERKMISLLQVVFWNLRLNLSATCYFCCAWTTGWSFNMNGRFSLYLWDECFAFGLFPGAPLELILPFFIHVIHVTWGSAEMSVSGVHVGAFLALYFTCFFWVPFCVLPITRSSISRQPAGPGTEMPKVCKSCISCSVFNYTTLLPCVQVFWVYSSMLWMSLLV